MKTHIKAFILFFIVSVGAVNASPICNDSKLFGAGLINKICWNCLFPVKIFGATISGGTGYKVPDGAASSQFLCWCKDPHGIPSIGVQMGMYMPVKLIEVVRNPYCSPVLGGEFLGIDGVGVGIGAKTLGGSIPDSNDSDQAYVMNTHIWAFPLYFMMELFFSPECMPGGFSSLDILSFSELNPFWQDTELGLHMSPETAIFASPAALAACTADCVTVTATQKPINQFFYCAGCWGNLYPLAGIQNGVESKIRASSLYATRSIALQHRMGLARKSMGKKAMCGSYIYPTIPKSQYKLSQTFPVHQSSGTCCQNIGKSTFSWGEHRSRPSTGEDFVHTIFSWIDCCVN